MCGRFQLKKDAKSDKLLTALKVEGKPRYSDDYSPGSWISFIHENGEQRINSAIWWLLLDHETHKPNYKYASFNSRSDKLDQPRSIAYKPYRESRCIILPRLLQKDSVIKRPITKLNWKIRLSPLVACLESTSIRTQGRLFTQLQSSPCPLLRNGRIYIPSPYP